MQAAVEEKGNTYHFDPNLPLTVATDASCDGTRTILSHVAKNGFVRHIAFASRDLTSAEKNYLRSRRSTFRDDFSIWPEVAIVSSATSQESIEEKRKIYARMSIPS
ncbi:hypothetical protein RF11_03823 [Thelohanellus kitauei]|uniref:Reverse transcriptase/retrotransposon-derived protein RNase H-like domain-containing protein n=1 Tax=Thelohanellus kitauei TaxID=669202 RepID=A0A0C2MXK6_THEKT|nr:hypothetical protein RF11_03823 [Thelohanellus kitauei]